MGAPGTGNNSGLAQQQQMAVSGPPAAATANANANAGGSGVTPSPSLKKLKREAAQRRKAQARNLKMRAEEQERLQRLEIDVLVEQQRLQRLERQRCEEDARQLKLAGVGTTPNDSPSSSAHGQPSLATLRSGSNNAVHSPLPLPASPTTLSQAYPQHHLNDHSSCNPLPRDSLQTTRLSRTSKIPVAAAPGSEHHIALVVASTGGRHQDQASETAPTVTPDSKLLSGRSNGKEAGGSGGGWRGSRDAQRAKQAQHHSMRAAVESRRRLARGPRSGAIIDSHPLLPLEDHRVVSTEYQAAGTQALMRVSLLAAGFVIGARGISARLIGQVTGAIVQSWTESCHPDSVPLRLFRIQGTKGVVQAAATLIEQAVSKYKELCDCKRRGEFVQREHMINGVEFYYQPPPRKAFAVNAESCCNLDPPTSCTNSNKGGMEVGNVEGGCLIETTGTQAQAQLSFNSHHVWFQHLQQQQSDHLIASQPTSNQGQTSVSSLYSHDGSQTTLLNRSITMQPRSEGGSPQVGRFFDWQHQPHPQQHVRQQAAQLVPVSIVTHQQPCHHELEVDDSMRSGLDFNLNDPALQQSMASLEQALQQVCLEQKLLQHNRIVGALDMEQTKGKPSSVISSINVPSSSPASLGLASPVGTTQLGVSLWSDVLNGHGKTGHSENRVQDHGITTSRALGMGKEICSGSAMFHLGSSLFSIFGSDAHSIPIPACNQIECHLDASSSKDWPLKSSASNCGVATSNSHFDLSNNDFLRANLPTFPFAETSTDVGVSTTLQPECSLYGHVQADSEDLCIVCLQQLGGVRLMACGHTSFCLNCVQGLINCPLCQEKNVGLHECGNIGNTSRGTSAGLNLGSNGKSNGETYNPFLQAKLSSSSYHSWNWVPEASV